MYERESIFFLNLCLPLFGRLGSRCCPVFFLQYYRCHWKVWAGDQPWSPFPCWALAECLTRLSKPKQGWALSKGVCRVGQPPSLFWELQLAPRAAAGAPGLSTISGPQLSGTGVLCATSSLCSNSAGLYSVFSVSPLLLLFMYC